MLLDRESQRLLLAQLKNLNRPERERLLMEIMVLFRRAELRSVADNPTVRAIGAAVTRRRAAGFCAFSMLFSG